MRTKLVSVVTRRRSQRENVLWDRPKPCSAWTQLKTAWRGPPASARR